MTSQGHASPQVSDFLLSHKGTNLFPSTIQGEFGKENHGTLSFEKGENWVFCQLCEVTWD